MRWAFGIFNWYNTFAYYRLGSRHHSFPRCGFHAPRQQGTQDRPYDYKTVLRFNYHHRADIVHCSFFIWCNALRLEVPIRAFDDRHDGNGPRARQETKASHIVLGLVRGVLNRNFVPRFQVADRFRFLGITEALLSLLATANCGRRFFFGDKKYIVMKLSDFQSSQFGRNWRGTVRLSRTRHSGGLGSLIK